MVPVYTVTRGSSQQYQVALNVEDLGDEVLLEAQDPETGDVLRRNRRKVDKDKVNKVRKAFSEYVRAA